MLLVLPKFGLMIQKIKNQSYQKTKFKAKERIKDEDNDK